MDDEQISEHLKRLGLDRWISTRKFVEGAHAEAKERGRREAETTLRHVLSFMDAAEAFEEAARDIKRAELTGDVDAMMQAMARLGHLS